MSESEWEACEMLRIQDGSNSRTRETAVLRTSVLMSERIASKKRKRIEDNCEFMNCDFILGSVAEVERLWSIAKRVLTDDRKEKSPIVFEALVFLNVNREYWDEQCVKEAMARSCSARVQKSIEEDQKQFTQ